MISKVLGNLSDDDMWGVLLFSHLKNCPKALCSFCIKKSSDIWAHPLGCLPIENYM